VPTATEPELVTFNNWTFRLRRAQVGTSRLLMMIHGWLGDENSMWVLARNLSPRFTVLAPRGPFPVAEGGYSWREIRPGSWGMASLEELKAAAEALLAFVDDWSTSAGMDAGQFDLMGFSQGAAMVYALTLVHPERVRRLAVLSGFFPKNGGTLLGDQRLSSKPIFITHGRQDPLLPVEQARSTVALLKKAGAQVAYCESDAGHKVSKECSGEMERFLEEY
jgi:phospholipase/carboxylesterase